MQLSTPRSENDTWLEFWLNCVSSMWPWINQLFSLNFRFLTVFVEWLLNEGMGEEGLYNLFNVSSIQSFTQSSIIYESTYGSMWSSIVILYLSSIPSNYSHKRSPLFPLAAACLWDNPHAHIWRAAVAFYVTFLLQLFSGMKNAILNPLLLPIILLLKTPLRLSISLQKRFQS